MSENPSLPLQGSIPDAPLVSVITVALDCPFALEATIRSVAGQTCGAIEHILIDGGSSDEILEVIRTHEAHITRFVSEPDHGIYDAINKGIGLSGGKFICLLRAGDTVEPDYLSRAVHLARADNTITYSACRRDGKDISLNNIDDGIYLHNSGISIFTCLVPKALYDNIGLYDNELRTVSELIWMCKARDAGVAFVKLEGFLVNFPQSRETPLEVTEQQFAVDEWIAAYRIFFPFLPEPICEAIYLYRFDERHAATILNYLSHIPASPDIHPQFALFLSALRATLKHHWQKRAIDSHESDEQDSWGETRINLANQLDLPIEFANIHAGSLSVTELAGKAELLRKDIGPKTVVFHYLKASSQSAEDSICEFIRRLSAEDSRAHVILCNRPRQNAEKEYGDLFAFNLQDMPKGFARNALNAFLRQLDPKLFVYHFCVGDKFFAENIDSQYRHIPAVFLASGAGIGAISADLEYSCFLKKITSNDARTAFITASTYSRDALTDIGIAADQIELISSSDDPEHATTRSDPFSSIAQLAGIREFLDRRLTPAIRITLLSTSIEKGAGYSALRVHKGLLAHGVHSRLIARLRPESEEQTTNVDYVDKFPSDWQDDIQPAGPFQRPNKTIFSVDTNGLPDDVLRRIVEDSDVISIHWYARFLSNANIADLTRSGKPVVFTIRDMHPLTGGCHYFHGCDNWKYSCYPCPQFLPEDIHLPRAAFERKKQDWDMSNVTVVVLSEHTRRIVEASPLFGSCRIERIPNSIDTDIFYPRDKAEARNSFNLPHDHKIIAYIPSSDSSVKGKSEAATALANLTRLISTEKITLLCAGYSNDDDHPQFNTVRLGYLNDRNDLAKFYSAADVTLVPSLEETFSNTAAESIACGTPVVGFATGAVADLAQGYRGMTVAPGDVSGLACAIATVLSRQPDREACHTHIATHYSIAGIGNRYAQLFEELSKQSLKTQAPRHAAGSLAAKTVSRPSDSAYVDYLLCRLRWATFAGDRSGISLIADSTVFDVPPAQEIEQKPDEPDEPNEHAEPDETAATAAPDEPDKPAESNEPDEPDKPDERKIAHVAKKTKPPTLLRSLRCFAQTASSATRGKAGFPKSRS